ncbi:unnamed protein product [Trifolium pratense]|uniref:Uncharacterized protein n=1 Tax=Trifolium pratense TaxID=57577 RepID=A0ACB0L0N1_TRIPR|nr:unnamed protein product [Trifolium pratense]
MPPKLPPKIRKFPSGCEKRKKQKRLNKLIQSQSGALNKFIIRQPQIPVENQNVGVGILENMEENTNVNATENENLDAQNMEENANVNATENDNVDVENADNSNNDNGENIDIFDPTIWDSLGEKCDRVWLVYSKELDRVFCFGFRIFRRGIGRGQLANEGFSTWKHVGERLREHETGMEHVNNMTTWYELRKRMQNFQTIDKTTQRLIDKEKEHRKNVLKRILSIVKFLAKHNLAFRGSNERLYQNSNGNFLGLIEMLAEFDPVVQQHIRRITDNKVHAHFLGHDIKNELILLLASAIKNEIIRKIKQAKYFSVILDCTPDVSHQEQMSLIIRYVDVDSSSVNVEESFSGFLKVNDTTGQGLFDVLQDELKKLDLDIFDVQGQGYDNGSNMKGKHQGVQKKFLDINPRAFYTPCGCHSLNLTKSFLYSIWLTLVAKLKTFLELFNAFILFLPMLLRWRIIQRKRQFDENLNTPVVQLSEEESFRVNYFLNLVDQAIVSLNKRFEQYQQYESVFGFLFSSRRFQSLDNPTLASCCSHFEEALKHNEQCDIDGKELCME